MKVSEMSVEELRRLVSQMVEKKLEELMVDPDAGLELREEIKDRLRRTSRIKRGIPASEVAGKVGITW